MSRDGRARPERSGLLLAGGRSTRFGEPDKALAELAGAPLLCHTAAGLAPAVDELVVNCRADQRDAFAAALDGLADRLPVRFAVDPVPDEGPVSGLLTGLRVTRGRHVAVAGCDQPFLRTATVADLFAHATAEGGTGDPSTDARPPAGAAPLVDDRPQPLGAVYRQDRAREAAVRTMAAGSQALRDVLARIDPVTVPVARGTVRDIDTQSDLIDVSCGQEANNFDSEDIMTTIGERAVRPAQRPVSNAVPLPDGGRSNGAGGAASMGRSDGGEPGGPTGGGS